MASVTRYARDGRDGWRIRFYIDGKRVAASTTFDMSSYSVVLQPIVKLQKAANTNADVFEMDYIEVVPKRA